MSLLNSLSDELKAAMRAKDSLKLEALRAIKSAVLLAKTATSRDTDLSEEEEIKLLQKLVKQRKDSAGIFRQQNRDDLAAPEEAQADVIAQFLPKQLSSEVIEKIIDEIIAKTPPHEVEARTQGKPMLGEGLIFPVPHSEIMVDPFEIPTHWARIIGMDFGWDHPTAGAFCAWDRDSDCFYVTATYKQRREVIAIHAAAINGWGKYPVAWPHDGYKHDQTSGEQIAMLYRNHGLRMLPEHATNVSGGIGTEAPVQEMLEAMITGKFKIFSHCQALLDELGQYHRKAGKIVKIYDDVISSVRYAWMMRRFANTSSKKIMPTETGIDYNPLYH